MDLVAPGRTFSCQGQGKVPRGSATTCAKRACCIYFVNTKINGEHQRFLDFTANKTLFKKDMFPKIQTMKKYVGE